MTLSPQSFNAGTSCDFSGRTAIVTGAGRGIGAATARLFHKAGANVVLVSRTESELREQVASIEKSLGTSKGEVVSVVADVSDESGVKRVFDAARARWREVDLLVNNAGLFIRANVEACSLQDWERVFAVNVHGAFLMSRELFRSRSTSADSAGGSSRRESFRPASIVNVSSLAGVRGTSKFPGAASYVAAKHAVCGLTEALAVEGKTLGIRVNAVAPGAVDTRMLHEAAPFLKTRTLPEDIARVIAFLADDAQSGAVTGSVLEVFSNE